jgi:hypothetical protein
MCVEYSNVHTLLQQLVVQSKYRVNILGLAVVVVLVLPLRVYTVHSNV